MVERVWLYLLIAALAVHLAISGAGQVAELRELTVSGERGSHWVLAIAGLTALAAVVVTSLTVARRLVHSHDELEQRTRAVAAAESLSNEWLWESDLNGRLTYSSEGVHTLLGYAPEAVVGKSELDLLYDAGSRRRAQQLLVRRRTALAGWQDVELTWMHQDGRPVRLNGSAVVVRDNKGRVSGFRGARRPVGADAPVGDRDALRRIQDFLADPEIDIALQPLISLADQRIVGVEALARFRDGRGPDQWFREAQACGMGKQLDLVAFETAAELLEEIPEGIHLSVNAGPDLLLDPRLRRRLVQSGLPLHRLVIEVTEHARVTDYAALSRAVESLREHRVRFAIDDTGAGYASLNHVLQLRPDNIKLDRGLITAVESDPARRALVTALVLLALELGAGVTGEGIETLGQLEALETLGVDHGQGYLIARPTIDRAQWATWWADRRIAATAPA
jgi:PAS domain S-box-containing protein